MATELRHNDPFPSSIFALLPQTLGRPSIAATASNDLESVDTFFRSMVVKGSTQLVHQAQTITKSIADTHNPNDESFVAKFKDHPQERRPALGRKQAKFSLKPVSSSLPNVDFSSIIADEDDPEKYYYFMEQLQNADKELHKIRKDTADQVELHQPTAARKRRPGLLGKTASYNHHISTNADIVETLAQEEPPDRRISISSNKVTDMEIRTEMHTEPIGESHISPAKNASVELQEITEGQDSQAGKGKKDSNLLEKLLYSGVDFNAEKGKTFLQQNLPMKPIHAGKICLPDLGDIQSSQHSASKVIASHGKGSAISLTVAKSLLEARSTFQKRIPLTDPLKELYSDPIDDSPSSGDNSLFKSKTKVSHSPISANGSPMVEIATKLGFEDEISSVGIEVGRSSGRKSISEEKHTEHSHHIEGITNPDTNGVVNDKDELDIGLQEGWDRQVDPIINNQRDFKAESLSCINQLRTQETSDHPPQLIGINTNSDSCGVSNVKSLSGVVDVDLQMEGNTMHQDIVIRNQPNSVKSVTSSFVAHSTRESLPSPPRRNKDHNCESLGANLGTGFSQFDEIPLLEAPQANAADPRASKAISSPSEATTLLAQHLDDILSPPEKNNKGYKRTSMASQSNERRRKARPPTQTRGKKAPRQSVADISNSLEATTSDQHIENMCSLPEENNEGHLTTSVAPQNDEERRQRTPSRAKTKKKYAMRQSLAGAGMVWEDGKRRSSRHRVRPLEHWRGERLLYGRIHDTLTTVIGVKYASPGKDSLKVESYVPEQYANLVAQAARY